MQREYEAGVMKQYPCEHKNLYDVLKSSASKFPEKTAVIDEKGSITYKNIVRKTDLLAAWLKNEFHIRQGERVGLLFVNSIEFYIAFYAVIKLGAIAVLVNTKMQSREIAYILGDTKTHCLIMNARWIEKIRPVISEIEVDRIVTEYGVEEDIQGVSMASMQDILRAEIEIGQTVSSCKDDSLTAVILHTSGTTGSPKGIMVSHKNIMQASYGYQEVEGLDENDISVLSVPVFHILGLSCVSTLFLYMGATLVVMEKYDTNKVLEAIERYHATHFHSVPAVYIKMLHEAERKYDLSSLRTVVCGGAVISDEYRERFCKMAPNASFRIAYGLTETAGSGVLSYEHKRPGREVPNCRLHILDRESGELWEYGEGEAVYEGPIVTTNVWGKETSGGPLLYTGDIVRKERNGDIYVLDRIRDVINRGGEKIFPSSIENALLEFDGVESAVVFPVKDKLYGEVPAAVLIQADNGRINLVEINKELPGKIGKYELPQYMEVWAREELPVTGNGKVKKRELREIFEKKLPQDSIDT